MDGELGNSNLHHTINKFKIGSVVHLCKIYFKNDKRFNLFSAQSDVYPHGVGPAGGFVHLVIEYLV